jgi:hypothetical protein
MAPSAILLLFYVDMFFQTSLADLTNCSLMSQQSEIFRTPCSTPRYVGTGTLPNFGHIMPIFIVLYFLQ